MKARFQGGPLHRQIRIVNHSVFEVHRPVKQDVKAWLTADINDYPEVRKQTGRYYKVPEFDNQGNTIFAWAGWK